MAKRYRLVKDKFSSQTNDAHSVDEQKAKRDDFDNRQIFVIEPHRRHTAGWAIVGIVIVALVVIAALWMNGVNSSLNQLNQAVNQNAAALSRQQAQMAAMQAQLSAIMAQLTQIQNNLVTFFSNFLQAMHRG